MTHTPSPIASDPTDTRAVATLGGGCFWCLDALYRRLRGVTQVVSGYAGGAEPNPTYEQVCAMRTGHAEVVQVTFDPRVVTYRELLEVFFATHDPTTPNRQGADVGPQYRSIVLTHDAAQDAEARALMAELTADDTFGRPIVTQVEPLVRFWPGEAYHQDYYARNARQGYCQAVIAPKVAKLRSKFADKLAA
jgi:peptide-methionine (S)-S-oxide reductase